MTLSYGVGLLFQGLRGRYQQMNNIRHVLYLHGFRSSPMSAKAKFLAHWFQRNQPQVVWCCPQLPASPRDSAALIHALVSDWPAHEMAVMGSSLGGFYATWLAAQKHCQAMLLNPAVHPARDLARYIGEHPVWQNPDDHIFFDPSYIDELKSLYVGEGVSWLGDDELLQATPDATNMLAVIATGDEVLDWREMSTRYAQVQQHLIQGSDHGLSDFVRHWVDLQRFFGFN